MKIFRQMSERLANGNLDPEKLRSLDYYLPSVRSDFPVNFPALSIYAAVHCRQIMSEDES